MVLFADKLIHMAKLWKKTDLELKHILRRMAANKLTMNQNKTQINCFLKLKEKKTCIKFREKFLKNKRMLEFEEFKMISI